MRGLLTVAAILALALAVVAGGVAIAGHRRWRTLTGGLSIFSLVVAVAVLVTLAAPLSPTTPPHTTVALPPSGHPAPVPSSASVYVAGWACRDLNATPQSCDHGQSLVALNGRDGTVRWKSAAPGQLGDFATGPLLYDGVLYAYSQDDDMGNGEIAAVRASDGKTLWRVPFANYAEMMEGMGDTLDVFATNPDHQNLTDGWMVVTLSVQDGSTQRTVLLPTEVENNNYFTLDGDVFYTCDAGQNVKAIQVSDGTLLWQSAYGKSAASADPCIVAVFAGVVYVSQAHGGMLFALRAGDGTLLWQLHGTRLREVISAANGMVYIIQPGSATLGSPCNPNCPITSTTPDTLFAIRARDGTTLWQRQFAVGSIRGGVLAGDTLYLGGGALTAVHLSDGKTLWQVTHQDTRYLVCAVLTGAVVVEEIVPSVALRTGTAYGYPMAVGTRDGSPFWQGSVWMGVTNVVAASQ